MSLVWEFFTKNGKSIAQCKEAECEWMKDIGKNMNVSFLKSHLATAHPKKFKQFKAKEGEKKQAKAPVLTGLKNTIVAAFAKQSSSKDADEPAFKKSKDIPIIVSLGAKRPWSEDGEMALQVNRAILEMMAADIQPLSLVENTGFQRLLHILQPHYKLPSRFFFTKNELPARYDAMKARVIHDLKHANYVSFTTDGWSSKNSRHSLLSLTAHFLDGGMQPQFVVLAAVPIKGRHTADNLRVLLSQALSEFSIDTDKVFMFIRDAASTMKKVTRDLGYKSTDCMAHKIQLAVKDGMLALDAEIDGLIGRVKKFVRKLRKSGVKQEDFANIQLLYDLPKTVLVKAIDVRWSSVFDMLERFIQNRQAVTHLSCQKGKIKFPTFSSDDWRILRALRAVLKPMYETTIALQDRRAALSSVIPSYKVIVRALTVCEPDELSYVREAIVKGLETRMVSDGLDGSGDKLSYADNKDLVLATLLDPRYKTVYFDEDRLEEYKHWLIKEAEKVVQQDAVESESDQARSEVGYFDSEEEDMWAEYERDAVSSAPASSQIHSPPAVLSQLHKAEIEVNEYLMAKKLPAKTGDPYAYWTGENALKWPLLAHLFSKYNSSPATSSESERLFSSAGLIVSDLRKSLTPEHVEQLLFLHHNLLIYDFEY